MISPKSPCILVMNSDVVLKRAAISLMNLEEELEVVVSEAVDVDGLANDVTKINPNVLLLSESQPVAAMESLAQLLYFYPGIRIIVVSVDSNWLRIFERADVLLNSLDDLLTVIRPE